jgi:exodeoxyribonuclease VII small subunit
MSDATITKAASPAKQPDIAGLSFEEALAELERIVRGLEGGQQRLEEAISAYERGSRLRQHCEAKLREAEMRVERIVAGQETAAAPPANMTAELDEEIPF